LGTRRTWTKEQAEEARRLYESDLSYAEVGIQLGRATATVRTMVLFAGGETRHETQSPLIQQRKRIVARVCAEHKMMAARAVALYDSQYPTEGGGFQPFSFEDISEGLKISVSKVIKMVMEIKGLHRCKECEILTSKSDPWCEECRVKMKGWYRWPAVKPERAGWYQVIIRDKGEIARALSFYWGAEYKGEEWRGSKDDVLYWKDMGPLPEGIVAVEDWFRYE